MGNDEKEKKKNLKLAMKKKLSLEKMIKLARTEDMDVIKALLIREDLPMSIINRFINHKNEKVINLLITTIIGTERVGNLLENYYSGVNFSVEEKMRAIGRGDGTIDDIFRIAKISSDKERYYRQIINFDSNRALEGILLEAERGAYNVIQHDENFKPIFMRIIAEGKNVRFKRALALRDSLPPNVIDILAGDSDYTTRHHVLKKHQLSDEKLLEMARDNNYYVKMKLVSMKKLPVDVLKILARDNYYDVRINVAKKRDLPDDVVQILLQDEEKHIRKKILERYYPEKIEKLDDKYRRELIDRVHEIINPFSRQNYKNWDTDENGRLSMRDQSKFDYMEDRIIDILIENDKEGKSREYERDIISPMPGGNKFWDEWANKNGFKVEYRF